MANELTISVNVNYEKGDTKLARSSTNLGVDVTGTILAAGVQAVGTSQESLNVGGVSFGGYLFLRNLDPTNYIEVRPGTSVADLVKLKPGEVALFRTASDASVVVLADTAESNLEFVLFSD